MKGYPMLDITVFRNGVCTYNKTLNNLSFKSLVSLHTTSLIDERTT